MEDFVRVFQTLEGDVYHITLLEDNSVLSSEALSELGGISLIGIELKRLHGNHVTGHEVLSAIANTIADFFRSRQNIVICYYCDFINPIPRTSKNSMPPQEYRSRLFEKMFQRYVQLNGMTDVRLSVVEINGINEKYYFHVIHREVHSFLASIIGRDLKDGFGK